MNAIDYLSDRRPVDDLIRSLTVAARRPRLASLTWQDIDAAIRPSARAGRTWEPDAPRGAFEPRAASCTVDVHAPPCGVEVYFARPWRVVPGHSHRTVERPGGSGSYEQAQAADRPALLSACAALLAAVDSGRAPMTPLPPTRYHGRPGPRTAIVAPLPVIPELVDGADVAARRETIDRVKPLLRAAEELAVLLPSAPPDVAARARRALGRVMDNR